VLLPAMRRSGYRWQPRWGWRGAGLGTVGQVAGWTFAGVAVNQVAFAVTSSIANSAGAQSGGRAPGRTVFDYAYLLFMMPHSLVAVSLVTAVFTSMSAAARDGYHRLVRDQLGHTLRLVGVTSVLALAGFIVAGRDLVATVFVGTPRAVTDQYFMVALPMLVGLLPFSALYLVQRVFYAYEDARTPFRIGLVTTAVWTAGNLLAARVLPAQQVVPAVAAAMSLSSFIGLAMSLRPLRRRLGDLELSRLGSTYLRLLLAGLVSVAVAWPIAAGWHALFGTGHVVTALTALVSGGALVAVFWAVARALRVTELDSLLAPVTSRLRSGR
jgi:putative peptidoglycan lipid II flippase